MDRKISLVLITGIAILGFRIFSVSAGQTTTTTAKNSTSTNKIATLPCMTTSTATMASTSTFAISTSTLLCSTSTAETASSTEEVDEEAAKAAKEEIERLNQQIEERKEKIKQMEDTIMKYQSQIVQKQVEAVSLDNQMGILDNQVAQIQLELDLTDEKIKETQLEMDALELSIQEKQIIADRQKTMIAKMIQSINSEDRMGYLEVMLTYKNFTEFYNEMVSNRTLYGDLGRSVKALRLALLDLSEKEKQVQTKQQVYLGLQQELGGKKEELDGQQFAKRTILEDTKSSEARFQALLAGLRSQYQEIENEQRTAEQKLKNRLEKQDVIEESTDVVMDWAVPSRYITATFHDPNYPFLRVMAHSGIDIRASYGTPVRAAASGYVATARHCAAASCYSYILIVHTSNLSSVYGHLSRIFVDPDQYVKKGDIIGYSGGTPGTVGSGPFSTGPHLHFEVRLNGIPVDPMPYMYNRDTTTSTGDLTTSDSTTSTIDSATSTIDSVTVTTTIDLATTTASD